MYRPILFVVFIFHLNSNILYSDPISPINNSTLNYIHVLFEWEQVPDAKEYRFQISKSQDFSDLVKDTTTAFLIYIDKMNIEWSEVVGSQDTLWSKYYWKIQSIDNNGQGLWSDIYQFRTDIKRSSSNAIIINDQAINPGLTIFGSFYNYYSAMIDQNGREVWNTGNNNIVYYNATPYLDLLGCYSNPNLPNNLPGINFSIDNSFIWEEPNDEFLHHDFIRLPNGNYLGIVSVTELGPIPVGSWTSSYQSVGFTADGVTNEFPWIGDKLVEWDKDTKEVVWSWSVFDHFSMSDYDDLGGTWLLSSTQQQEYDWTHVNAIIFSEEENAIYISIRHLSRITKISYPSGEVIWNMGRDMPSGDVLMGHSLGFSFQHSLQRLENGNIVTLDNGNLSQDFLGTEVPITRAIEISINNENANIVWEYSLSEDLFGFASGNVQKLDNGNYLITTVGGNGTSLEVSENKEVVWQGKYNLCEPICAVYRASRVPGLYPIAFSLTIDELRVNSNMLEGVYLPNGNAEVSFTLKNSGSITEIFNYEFLENLNWFDDFNGQVDLDPGEIINISFSGFTSNSVVENHFSLTITPLNKPEMKKQISSPLFIGELSTQNSHDIPPQKPALLKPYPNPFNNNIFIKVHGEIKKNSYIDIYDLRGGLVEKISFNKDQNNFQTAWNAKNFGSGIYLLIFNYSGESQVEKIIYLK